MADVDRTGLYSLAAQQPPSILLRHVLHQVAQPLTVLAALLDEAGQATEPVLAGDYLLLARGECHRAVAAFRSLQALPSLNGVDADREGTR